jgi:hypothetical protein
LGIKIQNIPNYLRIVCGDVYSGAGVSLLVLLGAGTETRTGAVSFFFPEPDPHQPDTAA